MEELNRILENMAELAHNEELSRDQKHYSYAYLWTRYHKLSQQLGIDMQEGHNMMVILKNATFVINQDTIKKEVDISCFERVINALNNNSGISEYDAINVLNWTVNNTLENLDSILNQLNINVWTDSLDGYCEIAQAISLIPLERLGLKVTKNNATDCFKYPYNHVFGTVTFPILENGLIVEKTYLIDCTYRQFFSTVYCNEGMYYYISDNRIAPDPGYFANKVLAQEILANGYCELTRENALLYGMPFFKAGLDIEKCDRIVNMDFYNNIKNITSNYAAKPYELKGFNLNIPIHYRR